MHEVFAVIHLVLVLSAVTIGASDLGRYTEQLHGSQRREINRSACLGFLARNYKSRNHSDNRSQDHSRDQIVE